MKSLTTFGSFFGAVVLLALFVVAIPAQNALRNAKNVEFTTIGGGTSATNNLARITGTGGTASGLSFSFSIEDVVLDKGKMGCDFRLNLPNGVDLQMFPKPCVQVSSEEILEGIKDLGHELQEALSLALNAARYVPPAP